MAFWNRKKGNPNQAGEAELDLSRLPKHIGIIMDGNGRWARKRGLPAPPVTPPGRRPSAPSPTTAGTWAFPI